MLKRGVIGVLLTMALWANVALAFALPVGDFFKDPEFSSVSMSPTGEYITIATPVENKTVLTEFLRKHPGSTTNNL